MPPSFMFLRNLKSRDNSTPVTSSSYTGPVMGTGTAPFTRKLRKLKSPNANQNQHHPFKDEESDPKNSHDHPTQNSVSNPSVQHEMSIPRLHDKQAVRPPPYHRSRDELRRYVLVDQAPDVIPHLATGNPKHQMVETLDHFTARSWSPIPSVHRESSQDFHEYFEDQFEGEGEESWANNVTQPMYSMDNQLQPRISTAATAASGAVVDVDSVYDHQRMGNQPPRITPRDFWIQELRTKIPSDGRDLYREELSMKPLRGPLVFEREYIPEELEVYNYIVPAGVDVIFEDEDGNEIARVGKKPHVGHGSVKSAPIIVHDEFGNELYRTKSVAIPTKPRPDLFDIHKPVGPTWDDYGFQSAGNAASQNSGGYQPPWLSTSPGSISSRSTKTIMVDEHGNQLVLKSPSITKEAPRRVEEPILGEISHHANIGHM